MKKILTLIFLMLVCAALFFGQAIAVQAQQEWKDFYYELNNAVQRFCSIAAS
jgi:hypothetical protein